MSAYRPPRPLLALLLLPLLGAAPGPSGDDNEAPPFVTVKAELVSSPAYRSPDGKATMHLLLEPGEGGAYLGRGSFLPGAGTPPHRHQGSEELIYVISGEGTMTLGNDRLSVKAGTAVRIPAGWEHSFQVGGAGPMEVVQVYSPGGPEQRFRDWQPAPVPGEPPRQPRRR